MVTITVRERITVGGLPYAVLTKVREAFVHRNPDYIKATRLGANVGRAVPKVIPTFRNEGQDGISVPRGGFPKLLRVFEEAIEEAEQKGEPIELAYEVRDEREHGLPFVFPELGITPRAFQSEIVRVGIERENVLVRSPTGSGKTLAAVMFIVAAGRWALVVVPTVELAKQFREEIAAQFGAAFLREHVGMVGDGTCSFGPITIGLPISLASRMDADVMRKFGTLVYDEVQRAAAPSFFNVVDKSPARYRLGVSADERRKDRKEFLVHEVFGDVAFEVSREELIDQNVVLDVEIRLVPTNFAAPWFEETRRKASELAEAVREKKKFDRAEAKKIRKEMLATFDRLLGEMSADAERNALIARLAGTAVKEGHRALVFTHRREHAEIIRADIAAKDPRVGLMLGGKPDAEEFTRARRGLKSGEVRCAIGTFQAMGAGIDLPAVSRGVCATPVHTNRPFFGQVRGRICRLGSEDAVLYYLWDRNVYGLEPLVSMVRWNRTVSVWDGGRWRNGREFLKEERQREKSQ